MSKVKDVPEEKFPTDDEVWTVIELVSHLSYYLTYRSPWAAAYAKTGMHVRVMGHAAGYLLVSLPNDRLLRILGADRLEVRADGTIVVWQFADRNGNLLKKERRLLEITPDTTHPNFNEGLSAVEENLGRKAF